MEANKAELKINKYIIAIPNNNNAKMNKYYFIVRYQYNDIIDYKLKSKII